MESAALYRSVQLILVHDPKTCAFPGYTEQPPTVRGFFAEKAITFLRDYKEFVVEQLHAKLLEKIQSSQIMTESHSENTTTRIFLSHKRLTAQAIAGRLYEGFKDSYKVFLDSEAQFKIHDLVQIVDNTSKF
jgi:hypothetical protein